MAPKVDALEIFIKTTGVSGISLVSINFTVKAFRVAWHIISTLPEEDTYKAVLKEIVICEECQKHFIDDRQKLEFGKFLCEDCLDYKLKK